jgi:hypothetical protein
MGGRLLSSCVTSLIARHPAKHDRFPHLTDFSDLSENLHSDLVVVSAALETLEGTLGVCADKVMLSGLMTNIQECSVHGMEFCCEDAIKTVEAIGKFLALVEGGTTGQAMKYKPISVNRCTVRVVKKNSANSWR